MNRIIFANAIKRSSSQALLFRRQIFIANPLISLTSHVRTYSSNSHENESYEDFTERYSTFFNGVQDVFELQRGLNNCFAYDLVPDVKVIEAALRASRRVNDLPTAVRVLEGLKEKVENKKQYEDFLNELSGVRDELGIPTKEELFGN